MKASCGSSAFLSDISPMARLKTTAALFIIQHALPLRCRRTFYLLQSEPIGRLGDFARFPDTPPHPSSTSLTHCPPALSAPACRLSGLPHLVTMNLYTTITAPARLSISPSNLSAVSGVAERLAGVKGQLINGTQFDKSQRLLSSSRVFRAERSTTEINA